MPATDVATRSVAPPGVDGTVDGTVDGIVDAIVDDTVAGKADEEISPWT